MSGIIVIYTTEADAEKAKALAQGLVEQKLVACANIGSPHLAVYEWDGQIENEQEVSILFKTKDDCYDEVERYIKNNHSYDVPLILSWKVDRVSKEYTKWVDEQLG